MSWNTVKRIDKARLIRELPPVRWSEVHSLVTDEFALHKGHRYVTVIADADTRQARRVVEGSSRLDLRPFFEQLLEANQPLATVYVLKE